MPGRAILTALAVFNLLVGSLGFLVGTGLTLFIYGMGGGMREVPIGLSLVAAGLLYGTSGACLLLQGFRNWAGVMTALCLAIVFGAIYCVGIYIPNSEDFDPNYRMHFLFIVLPALVVIIATVEAAYLFWRRSPA